MGTSTPDQPSDGPFEDLYVDRAERFALGVARGSDRPYLSIPVSNRRVDYEEHYELSPDELDRFLADPTSALELVRECRARRADHRLLRAPGADRGTAS